MTYALRACSCALLAGSEPGASSGFQAAASGGCRLLMAVRGHLGDTPDMRRRVVELSAWESERSRLPCSLTCLGEVSGDDRGEPLVTGSNGPLMARTRGAGFPALVQGRSCRVPRRR
jgi:hypothetical protein